MLQYKYSSKYFSEILQLFPQHTSVFYCKGQVLCFRAERRLPSKFAYLMASAFN